MAAEAGVEEAILEEKLQHQSGDLGYVQNPSSFIEKEVIDSKEHQNPISVVFDSSQTIGPSQTYGAEAATGEGITIDEKAKNENLHSIAIGILDKSEGEVFVEAPSRDQIPFSNDADVDLHGNNSVEGKKEDLESAILVKKERENEVQERKEEKSATENNLSLSEKMHEIEKMESPEAEQVQNHGTLEDQIENREQESAVAMTSPEKIDTREITENEEVARKEGKIEHSLDKKLEESCKVPESENVRQDVPRPVSVNELHSSTADDKTVQDQEITHTSNEKETVIQEDENDARNFNASPYSHLRNQIESITEERKAEELQETSEVVQNKDQLHERGISQEEMEPHRVNSDMQLSQAQNEEVDEQDEAKITQTNQNESHDMEVSLGLLGQKFIHEMKEKIRDMEMIASGGETNEAEAIMTDEAEARMNVDEEQKRTEEHNEFNEMKQEKQTFEDNMQIDTCHGTLTKHSPDNVLEDDKCQEKFEISNNEIPEKIIMSKIGVSIEEAAAEPPEKTQVPQEEGEEVVTAEETIARIITEDPSSIPHCEDEKVPEMVNAYFNTETSQEDNLKKDAKDTPTNDTQNLHKVYDPAVRKLEETPSCVAEELIQQTTTTKDNVDIQMYKESTEPENLAVISNSMNKDQNGKSEELRLDNSRKDDKPQDEGGIEKTAGDIPVTVCKKQEDSNSVAEEQNNQTKDFDDNKKDDVNREKMESENLELAPDLVHEEKMQQSVNELEAEGTHNFTNDVNHNDMASQIHVVFHDNETAKAKNDSILDNKMDENKYELVMDNLIEKNEQPLNSDRKTDTLQVSREILEETLHIINEKHEDDKHEVCRNMDLIEQDPISETVEEICRMSSGEQIHEAIADKNIMNFANSQGIVYMNKEVGSSSFTQNPLEENTLGAAILEESDKNIYDETSVEVALEDTHETKEANKRIEGVVSTDELAYKVRGVTFGEEQKEGEELNKKDELKGGEETIKEISSAISPPNTMDEYLDHVHQNDKSEKEHENTEAEVLETTILAEINSSTRELVEEKDLPNQQEESFEEKAKIWTPQEEALVGSNIAKASDSRENEDSKISDIIHVNINKEPTRDNDKDMNKSISDVPDTDDLVGQHIQAVNNNQEIVLDFKCKEKIAEASHTKESTVADNIEEACQKLESISELVHQSKTPEGTSEVMMSQNSKNDANLSADIIDASEITENKEFAKMEQPQVSQGNVDILANTEASIIQKDQMISKYDEGICSMQHKEDSLPSEDGIQNTNMDKGEDEKDTIEVSYEEENLGGDCHVEGSVNTRDNIPRAVSVDESHPTPTTEDKTFQDQEITDTEDKTKNVIWTEDESEDNNFDAFYKQLPRQEDSGVEEENHENLELTFELEKNKDQGQETLDVLDEMGLHSVESDMQIFNTQNEEVNDQDEADDNHMQMNQTECHDVEVSSEVIVHEVVLEDKTDEAEARMNLDEENKKYNQDNELIQEKEASEDNMQVNACDGAPINQTLNDTLEIDKCKENIEISSIEITEKTIEYEIYASIEEDAAAAEKEHSVKSKLPQEESEAVLTTEKAVARISIEDPGSIPDNEDEKNPEILNAYNTETAKEVHLKKSLEDNPTNNVPILEKVYDPVVREPEGTPCCVAEELVYQSTTTKDNMDIQMYQDTTMAEKIAIISNSMSENQNGKSEETSFDNSRKDDKPQDEEGLEKNIGEVPETWITNDEILNNMASEIHVVNNDQETATAIQEDSISYVANEQINQTTDTDDNKKDEAYKERVEYEKIELTTDMAHENQMQQSESDDNLNNMEASEIHDANNDQETATAKNDSILEDKMNENYSKHELIMDCFIEKNEQALISGNNADTSPVPRKMIEETLQITNEMHEDNKDELCKVMEPVEQDPISENGEEICRTFLGEHNHEAIADTENLNFATILAEVNAFAGELVEGKDLSEEQGENLQKKTEIPQEEAPAGTSIAEASSDTKNEDAKISDAVHVNDHKEPTRENDEDMNNSISDVPDTDQLVGLYIQGANNNQEIVLDSECIDSTVEESCQKLESISEVVHQSITHKGTSELIMSENSENHANLSPGIVDASEIIENKESIIEQPQVSQGNIDILADTEAPIIQKDQVMTKYEEGTYSMPHEENSLPTEGDIQDSNLDKGEDEKDTIEVLHEKENLEGDCQVAESVNTRDNIPRAVSVDESHPVPTAEDKTFQDQEITHTENKKENAIQKVEKSDVSNSDASYYLQLPKQEDSTTEERNSEKLQEIFELVPKTDQFQEKVALNEMELHTVKSDVQIFHTRNEEVNDQDKADDKYTQKNQNQNEETENNRSKIMIALEDETDEAGARMNLDEEKKKHNEDNELKQEKQASEENMQMKTCDETPTDQTLDDVQEKEVCKATVEVSSIEIPDKILKYEIGTSILEVAAAAEKEHSEKSELRQVDEAVLTSEREVTRTNTEDPSSIPDFEDEKVPEMASIYHDNETTKVMDGGNLEQNVEAAPTSDIPVLQSIHDQVAKETEETLNCVAEELIHQTTTTQDNIGIDTCKGSTEAEKLFISNSVKEECNYKSEEIDLDNLRKDDTTQVYEIHDRENDQETAKAKDDNILENNMEDDSNKYEMVMDSLIQKNEQAANLDKNIGTSLMPKKFIEETVQIRNEMHEDGNDSVSENMDLIEQHLVSRSVEELYKAFSGEQNHEAIADTEITDVVNSLDNVNMDRIVGSLCSTQTPLEKTTGKASSPQESLDADLEDKHEKVEANKGMECVVSNDEQTNKLMVEGTSIEEQKEGEEINKKNELNQQEDSLMMVEGTSIEEQKEGEELNKKNELNQQEETIKEDMDSEIFLENTTEQFPQNVIKNDTAEVLDTTISAEVNASTRELTEQKDPPKEQEKSLQEKAGVCTPQEEAQVGIGVAHLSDNPDKKDEKDCRMTQKMEFQATESELTATSQHVVRKTTKDQEAVKDIDEKFKNTESSAHGKLETTTETGLVEVEPSCDENISDAREDSLCTMEASDMNTIQINIAEVTSEAHKNVSREDNETKETALLENENRKEQEVDKCLLSNKTKNEEEERNYLNPPEVKVSGKIYTNECIEDRTQEKKIKESGSQVESMKDVETENVLNIFYAMDEINKENKSVMDAENNEDQEDETRLESEEDEDKEEDNIQPDMKVYEAATTSEYNEENIKEKTTVKSVSESQKLEDVEAKNPIYMVPDELEIADKDTCTDEERQGGQLKRADLEEKFEKNKDRARKAVEEVGPFSSNEQIHACDATDNLSPQEQITKIVDSDMTIEDNHRKMVDDPCITAEFHEEMKNVAKFLPQMETLDFKSLKETETSENFVSQDVRGSGQNEISGLNFQDYPRKVMKLQQQSDEEVDGLKIEYPNVENENIIADDNTVPEPEVSGVKDAASEHITENNDESNDMEPKDMLEAKRSVTIPQQSQKKMINNSDNISSDQGPIIMDPSEKRGTTTLIDEEERNGSFVIIETDGEVIKYGDKDLDEVSEFFIRESAEGNIETQAMHVEAANGVGINETGEKCHDETSISLLPSEAIVTRDQDDRVNLEETLKSESDVSIAEKDDHSVEFRENKELLGNLSTTQATETSILEDEKDRLEEAEGPSCEVAGLNRSKSEEYELIDHDDLPVSHLMEGILQRKHAKLGGVEAEAKVEENISVQNHDTSIPKQDSILVSRSTEHVREDTSTMEDKVGKKFEDSSGLMLECSHDNVIGNNTKELIVTEDERPERNTNDDSPASKVGGNVYEDFSKADSLHHDEKIQTSIIGKTSGIPMHEDKENKMDIFSKEGGIEDMRIFKGVEKIDQDSNALLHEQLAFTSEPDEDAKILDNGEQSQLNLQTDEIGKYDSLIIDNTIEGTKIQSKGVKIESSRENQDAINELRIQNVKSDLNEQYMSFDSHEVQKLDTFVKSTDKVVQEEKFKEEISPKVLMDERQTNKTTDTHLDDDKTDEENDEKEDEDDHKIMESSHDSAVPVEARDAVLKPAHKKSHNILSGVGSKVKRSIAKVKKVITGKSSHSKTLPPP
ncbi:unnamed protein product [Musa acuminata subsp. burmannicoides]